MKFKILLIVLLVLSNTHGFGQVFEWAKKINGTMGNGILCLDSTIICSSAGGGCKLTKLTQQGILLKSITLPGLSAYTCQEDPKLEGIYPIDSGIYSLNANCWLDKDLKIKKSYSFQVNPGVSDKNGNLYDLPHTFRKYSKTGIQLLTTTFNGWLYAYGINSDKNSNIYISGFTYYNITPNTGVNIGSVNYPIGDKRNFLLKIDSVANPIYFRDLFDYDSYSQELKIDNSGNVYSFFDGGITATSSSFVSKYGVNGNHIWSYTLPKPVQSLFGYGGISISKNDRHLFIASKNMVIKLDSSGNQIFEKQIKTNGSSNYPIGTSVSSDIKDNIYVTGGLTNDTLIFDCITLTGSGAFIAKLYTGTVPSFAQLSLSGIELSSNIQTGNYWYRNDTLLVNENKPKLLLLRDGLYKVKAYCKEDSIRFSGIRVNTLTGILETVSIPGADYQWYLNGVSIAGANSYTYTGTAIGTYSVIIHFDNGNLSNGRTQSANNTTAFYRLQVSNLVTQTESQEPTIFNFYPNPNQGEFTIQRTSNNPIDLEIVDVFGRTIQQQSLIETATKIQISHFGKGVYYLKIGSFVKSVVVW